MRFIMIFTLGVILMGTGTARSAEYLSDLTEIIAYSTQGWGELGIDTCAHAQGQAPLKLQIKDQEYAKGLGHHAPGEIIISLDGLYGAFEAEVGVQWQDGNVGSVVFQVFVDEEKRFDSGAMREQDPAKPISIPVSGAQEMRLVVTDAGDGITCDCANWANVRLTRSVSPAPTNAGTRLNIAPFAQVITCDPNRMDGARANRVQEFHAEELFLETEILPGKDGMYSPQQGCIGLKWAERRLVKELGLEFAGDAPSPDGAQVQAWVGQTLVQGEWKPLKGAIDRQEGRWVFPISWKENPDARTGIWKVRWILPTDVRIRSLSAFTSSTWNTTDLLLQLEKPMPGKHGHIEVYNGAIVDGPSDWDLSKPLHIKVLYSTPRPWKYDRSVLRLKLPNDAFAVAVDDVLANGCVYVEDSGIFVSKPGFDPAAYLRKIAKQKTVLERVIEMPDQTLEQAMTKTRNPIQDNGPTMISLACDNHKFMVEQDGTVRFSPVPGRADWVPSYAEQFPCAMTVHLGDGKVGRAERHLHGGWLPVPVSTWQSGGATYSERCFVAPYDKTDTSEWLNKRPLCVAEFTITNPQKDAANVSLGLNFFSNREKQEPAEIHKTAQGAVAQHDGRLLASIDASGLQVQINGGLISMTGVLPAGGKAACFVYFPGWEMKPEGCAELKGGGSLLRDVEAYWNRVMAPAIQVEIPNQELENIIRASQVHCMMASRNEADGARIAAWAGADRYGALESESNSIIRGMDFLGQTEFARRAHDYFIKRYNSEGFLTTGYTLIGTGWHLWTVGEHYRLTRDKAWMNEIAPTVARACEWIIEQRNKTKRLDAKGEKAPEYGLMPPGVMADWGNFLNYFCLNGYYYAGLHESAKALANIKYPGADVFLKDAEEFRRDILTAYKRTQSLTPVVPLQDGTWVKAYPSQLYSYGPLGYFFPGEDGNRSWCYDVELGAHQIVPQGVLDADSEAVAEMMDHMEDVQFLSEGWFDYPAEKNHADWFNMGGFSKVQPYYCRNAEIYAMRDDVKPFIRSYFNTLSALVNTESLAFWEHFHNCAAWHKPHETGYFLQQTHWMLLMDRDDRLWIAPFVTSNWLKDGMEVAVRNAPSCFGKVSYRIESHVAKGIINVSIEPPKRNPPKEIIIRLRHPDGKRMRSVTVNGKPHKDFDPAKEIISLPGTISGKVEMVVGY